MKSISKICFLCSTSTCSYPSCVHFDYDNHFKWELKVAKKDEKIAADFFLEMKERCEEKSREQVLRSGKSEKKSSNEFFFYKFWYCMRKWKMSFAYVHLTFPVCFFSHSDFAFCVDREINEGKGELD